MYKIVKTICYGIEETSIIYDDGTGRCTSFPAKEDNPNWQAYQAWLAEGNTPLPPA